MVLKPLASINCASVSARPQLYCVYHSHGSLGSQFTPFMTQGTPSTSSWFPETATVMADVCTPGAPSPSERFSAVVFSVCWQPEPTKSANVPNVPSVAASALPQRLELF